MRHIAFFASAAVLAFAASAPSAKAEEGMWTFDNFPIARANSTLGTSIDQGFLLDELAALGGQFEVGKQRSVICEIAPLKYPVI